ncbi:hypothetical protein KC878_03925 [Candidatus Saccharibacteria bacterium]|nr:hypothetical protein [Candidatus Saccharibacteria bacterium]
MEPTEQPIAENNDNSASIQPGPSNQNPVPAPQPTLPPQPQVFNAQTQNTPESLANTGSPQQIMTTQQPVASPSPYPQVQPQVPPMPQPAMPSDSRIKRYIKPIVIAVTGAMLALGAVLLSLKLFGGAVKLEEYTNKELNFSIMRPSGWEVDVTDEPLYKYVSFVEPIGDVKDTSDANTHYASLSISLEDNPAEYSKETETEFFDGLRKNLVENVKRSLESSEGVTEEADIIEDEMVNINGLNAYRVKLKITNFNYVKGEIGYEYLCAIYVDDFTDYTLRLAAHESDTKVIDKVNDIFDSFKVN